MIDPAALFLFAPRLLAQADAAADEAPSMSLLDFITAGGPVGYLIILLSFGAFALVVMHLFQLRLSAIAPQYAVDELTDLLTKRRIDDAIAYCSDRENASFLTDVLGQGLRRYRRSPFGALELKAALEEAGQEQVSRLSRSTDALALVASIAPMLGLLGTVVGINGAFATISSTEGFARPDQLAGDISLALVTTIMGLILAIPATAAVTYFRNRIESLAAEAAFIIDDLALIVEAPASGANAPAEGATSPTPGTAPQAARPGAPARPAGPRPAAPTARP